MEESETARQPGLLLACFAKDLMVVQRHSRSYPAGHPVVETALQNAVASYGRLMEQFHRVTIAIAKDHLAAEGLVFDRNNPFLRQFARLCFRQGIGLMTLGEGLTAEELKQILVLLNAKRDDAFDGGIEATWEAAGIRSLSIRSLRYDILTTTGSEQSDPHVELLWERIARGLLESSLSPEGHAGEVFDPEIIAEIFNGTTDSGEWSRLGSVLQLLLQEEQAYPDQCLPPSLYQRLASFVERLTPELRDQFLAAAGDALRPDGSSPMENVLREMSRETLLGMLHETHRSEARISPFLLGVLQKLAFNVTPSGTGENFDAVMENISSIFTEHSSEQYIPEAYQRKLQSIIASHEHPAVDNDVGSLLNTLEPATLELKVSEVILQLAVHGGDKEELERLAESMEEMCSCRLQTGQYDQVLEILRRVDADQFPREFRERFRDSITRKDVLQEVLNGLSVWGKSRYLAIRELICTIGHPFIEPLLDNLAVEENISIRRFIINQLVELGPQAKDEVLNRLASGPWYYLRNLLIVLRSMEDESLAMHVRPLLNHQNETVRQEALRTLQHFGDAFAQRRIATDLESADRSIVMTALHVVGKTRSPEIFRKILALATQGGLSQADVELRCAAVRALGEIGAVAAFAELVKVLHSSSLLRSKALARIKSEIVRSLALYPPAKAVPLLKALAQENDGYSGEAAEMLKTLKENP